MSDMYFNPVQGLESAIFGSDHAPGTLYFATDTGKMILDTLDNRITLGNTSANIFYANATNLVSNVNGSFNIFKRYFDDPNALPKTNDLIINKDGRFFKVISYSAIDPERQFANCALIAVSGTGGGSSTGPSTPSQGKDITITFEPFKTTFIYNSPYTIQFVPVANYPFLQASYEVFEDRNNEPHSIDKYSIEVDSGNLVDFNMISRRMEPGKSYKIVITVTAPGLTSEPIEINNVTCIDFKLHPNPSYNGSKFYDSNRIMYSVIPEGKIARELHISVDGKELPTQTLSANEYTDGTTAKEIEINLSDLGIEEAGIHTIKTYLMAQGISSNEIVTDIIYHPRTAAPATYVILLETPSNCYSYEIPQVKYWAYDTSLGEGADIKIKLSVNGVSTEITQIQKNGVPFNPWPIANLTPNTDNYCEIECNKISRGFYIYCQKSEIYDEETIGALLLLDTKGRTNNVSLEERLKWSYGKGDAKINAELTGFNWDNNGWILDSNNRSCLRVSNGAAVTIPLSVFSNLSTTTSGFTFEFEFKPYNLYNYNLLNQETVTEGKDQNVTITRDFDSSKAIISYMENSLNNKVNGLCLGTQDAVFRFKNGDHATVQYTNNEIINVTVVLDIVKKHIYIYLNGIMSGVSKYIASDTEFPLGAENIVINSEWCDIDLYNIRIYQSALNSKQVVQNYVASKQDLSIALANNIAENNTVSLSKLIEYNTNEENQDNLTIPYIIFTTKNSTNHLPYDNELPDIPCDITFVNPILDQAFNKGEITAEEYKNKAPSFQAFDVPVNAQGTSSLTYPRKNFKGKFKDALRNGKFQYTHKKLTDKTESRKRYYIRDNMAETTFTWKADFMDSSSSHNTGFASYAHELYWNHPLDYYVNKTAAENRIGGLETGSYHQRYRTTLFGFPVLAFHQKGVGSEDIEFIGCYNFNLDKGADRTLGMDLEEEHPYVTYIDENGQEKHKTYAEVCECWEMANNTGGRCSFRGDPFDQGYEFKDGKVVGGVSNLGSDIEVRYHKDGDTIEGAWINYSAPPDKGGHQISAEEAYEVLLGYDRTGAYSNLERFYNWLQDSFFAFDLDYNADKDWVETLLNRPLEYIDGKLSDSELDESNVESYAYLVKTRKDKFITEFDKHLNLEYCLVYYILTELLLQFDSRGKNMMFASWGPIENGGEYIWFPIFYDIDTQLGVNNAGVPSWGYNVEPTTGFNNFDATGKMQPAFSSPTSLLWQNFAALYDDNTKPLNSPVATRYRLLRGHNLNIGKINKYYNFGAKANSQTDELAKDYCRRGIVPASVFNANEYYKYILPSVSPSEGGGYVSGQDGTDSSLQYSTESGYFYCLQGTRSLYRDQFLRNRFNYYDSKWKFGNYNPAGLGGNSAYWRFNPTDQNPDPLMVKTDLDQYVVIWADTQISDSSPIISTYAKGGEVTAVDWTQLDIDDSVNQQIVMFGGKDHIQEFGHLSPLYPDQIDYGPDSVVKIDLGNDDPDYIPHKDFSLTSLTNQLLNKPLLKTVDITNVFCPGSATSFNFIDSNRPESGCKLEEFKALGANIGSVTFPAGAVLNKVYFPDTVTKLEFLNTPFLNIIKYDDDFDESYENCLYLTGIDNVEEINMRGSNFGYDSYVLLQKLINKVENTANKSLRINLTDVQWSPYIKLGAGATQSSSEEYYYVNDNNTFSPYSNTNSWTTDVRSGKVYKKIDSTSTKNIITDLSLLDTILQDTTHNKYQDMSIGGSYYPNLTGELYINNSAEYEISEAELYDEYIKYFPKLSIKMSSIKNSCQARFVVIEDGVETEIYTLRTDIKETPITEPNKELLPIISHKEFEYWTDDKGVKVENFDQLSFTNQGRYVFYAKYKETSYKILFTETDDAQEDKKYNQEKTVKYGEVLSSYVPEINPSRPKQEKNVFGDNLNGRYVFEGWTSNKNQGGIAPSKEIAKQRVENLANIKSDKNYVFYPVYYKDENVLTNPTDAKYFESTALPGKNGCSLSLKSNCYLTGKITIPALHTPPGSSTPLPVLQIDNFRNAVLATHIFFEKGSQITTIGEKAFDITGFAETPTIEGIYLPDSVTELGEKAFYGLHSLKYINYIEEDNYIKSSTQMGNNIENIETNCFSGVDINYPMNLQLTSLSSNLIEIGANAFKNCIFLKISTLPNNLTTIEDGAFAFCLNVTITDFHEKISTIGTGAFRGYDVLGTSPPAYNIIERIYVRNPDCKIRKDAFKRYGSRQDDNSSSNVTLYTPNPTNYKAEDIGVRVVDQLTEQ